MGAAVNGLSVTGMRHTLDRRQAEHVTATVSWLVTASGEQVTQHHAPKSGDGLDKWQGPVCQLVMNTVSGIARHTFTVSQALDGPCAC